MILAHILPTWLWEITHWPVNSAANGGYGFFSGIAGSFLVGGGIGVWWSKHNCHIHRCPWLSWHPGDDGHPYCKIHHKDHPSTGFGFWRIDRNHPRHASNIKATMYPKHVHHNQASTLPECALRHQSSNTREGS